ncbi:hypothetical protein LJC64_05330, partial [Ruminococcaceae bacterium OttesenSCG-928-A11]|nr:hypothetical protein [Ruminococcaceae bacterium OttesenSCG-928-A11]
MCKRTAPCSKPDQYSRLIREDNQPLSKTWIYAYNNGGNITSVKECAYSTTGILNPTTYSYTYGDAAWRDKLTSYNGQAITYDAIGNPLSYRG